MVARVDALLSEKLLDTKSGKMVGLAGFEPTTSRTPSVRATKLRYSPTFPRFGKNRRILEVTKGSTPIPSPSTI